MLFTPYLIRAFSKNVTVVSGRTSICQIKATQLVLPEAGRPLIPVDTLAQYAE